MGFIKKLLFNLLQDEMNKKFSRLKYNEAMRQCGCCDNVKYVIGKPWVVYCSLLHDYPGGETPEWYNAFIEREGGMKCCGHWERKDAVKPRIYDKNGWRDMLPGE
jgi:hypothetical protein